MIDYSTEITAAHLNIFSAPIILNHGNTHHSDQAITTIIRRRTESDEFIENKLLFSDYLYSITVSWYNKKCISKWLEKLSSDATYSTYYCCWWWRILRSNCDHFAGVKCSQVRCLLCTCMRWSEGDCFLLPLLRILPLGSSEHHNRCIIYSVISKQYSDCSVERSRRPLTEQVPPRTIYAEFRTCVPIAYACTVEKWEKMLHKIARLAN